MGSSIATLGLRLARGHMANGGAPNYVPMTVKSADGHVNGFYRNAFQAPVADYARRWMCETVSSAIRRISGGTPRSRKQSTLFTEAALKVAAYAIKVQRPAGGRRLLD